MSTAQFAVSGQSAIITGASSGIGLTTAKQFVADGTDVAICSREQKNVDEAAADLNEMGYDGRVLPMECDVRDREAIQHLINRTVREFGTVDVLVNNAGGDFPSSFEDISENGWKAVVDINLHGVFHCTQVAGEVMRKDGGGTVVNLSSMFGSEGIPNMTHYGASKAGVENLTKSLAVEWAPHDIRVNCVAPGFVQTEALEEMTDWDGADLPPRSTVDRQIGEPEEIADVIQFLASDASSFVVGETLAPRGVPDIQTAPERLRRAGRKL